MKLKKALALLHYAIMITVVASALAAMHVYLRRGIQAKVKDLTDHIICERQLASLSDPATEKSTRNINSTYNLQKNEGAGGMSNLSVTNAYTVEMSHEGESLETIDYGRGVASVATPVGTYSSHSDNPRPESDGDSDDSDSSGRGSGGGAMFYGNEGSE